MRNVRIVLLWLLVCGISAACYTKVIVRRDSTIDPPPGVRYSLPRPVVAVLPDPSGNGGFDVSVHALPDEDETYAIDAKSIMGKFNVVVEVEDGLLKSFTMSETPSDVAAEAIRAGSEIAKGELARRSEEEKEAQSRAAEAAQAAKEKRKKLEEALAEKQASVDKLEAEVAFWERKIGEARANGQPTGALEARMLEAELLLAKARVELEAARSALERIDNSQRNAGRAFREPDVNSRDHTGSVAWGPVLYALVDTCDPRTFKPGSDCEVRLEAIAWPGESQPKQKLFPTAVAPKPKDH